MGSKTNIDLMRSLVGGKKKAPKVAPKAVQPLAEEARGDGELTPEALRVSVQEAPPEDAETVQFRVGQSRIGDGSREMTLETDMSALARRSTEISSGEIPAPVDGAKKAHPAVVPRVAAVQLSAPLPAAPKAGGSKMDKVIEEMIPRLLPILTEQFAEQLKPLREGLAALENRFNEFMQGEGDVPASFEVLNQELEELKEAVSKKADHGALEALDDSITRVNSVADAAKASADSAKQTADGMMSGDLVPASFEALNTDVEEVKAALKKSLGDSYERAEASAYTTDVTVARLLVLHLSEELDQARADNINELLGGLGVGYCVKVLESFVKSPRNASEELADLRGYKLVQLEKPEENDSPTDAIEAKSFVEERTRVVVENAQYILEALKQQGEQ